MNRHLRLLLWICTIALCCAGMWALTRSLAQMQIDRAATEHQNMRFIQNWWIASAIVWAGLSAMAALLATTPADALRLKERHSRTLILLVAVAARVAVLLTSSPQLSDDIWRYIRDGSVVADLGNPYAQAPVDDEPSAISDLINHPQLVTIYPPASQITFGILTKFHFRAWDPLGDRTFRAGFIALDVLIILLIMLRLQREKASPWWAALYAWHPLAISEVAQAGHQDVVGIAMLLLALTLVDRATMRHKKAASAGAWLAASTAVKPVVAPLLLPLCWEHRKQRPLVFAMCAGFIITLMGLYIIFAIMPGGLIGMWNTSRTYVEHWGFNASLFDYLNHLLSSRFLVLAVAGLMVLAALVWTTMRRDPWRAAGVFLLALLLCSSTVHPWYLLWALALVPLRFCLSTWVWSATIMLSYAALESVQEYQVPAHWWLAEYTPVYCALILQGVIVIRRAMTTQTDHAPQPEPAKVP